MQTQSPLHTSVRKLTCSAMLLAIALLLPFLTGQIPEIGRALAPLHLPVLLCGFLCGWPWGLAVGILAPLLRSLLFSAPLFFPNAFAMSFELAAYGFATGFLYRKLPQKPLFVYVNLILSMIFGRLIWGAVRFIIAGLQNTTFDFAAFYAGAIANAIPGIISQLILIPILVIALKKARLFPDDTRKLT